MKEKVVSLSGVERKLFQLWRQKGHWRKEWLIQWMTSLQTAEQTPKSWLRVKPWHNDWTPPRLEEKWADLKVDFELREEWLERVNSYAECCGGRVCGTCAGHPHRISANGGDSSRYPSFAVEFGWPTARPLERAFAAASALAPEVTREHQFFNREADTSIEIHISSQEYCLVIAKSTAAHTGRNQDGLARWWETALGRFEELASRSP